MQTKPAKSHRVLLIGCCLLTIGMAGSARADDSPVRVEYLSTRGGKPPMQFISVRLTLVNDRDKPAWFLLPYWGETPLPESGVFKNKNAPAETFGGKRFDGEGGSAIEVMMYGDDGFKAFRLPARGRVELGGYDIEADKDIHDITILEADELKVNGTTLLEKWLPYATTSGEKVKVIGRTVGGDWKNLDWDEKKLAKRDDYPKDKVDEVKAEGIRRWPVKFNDAAK
jgi:hypothetical protein